MSPTLILSLIAGYFVVLMIIAYLTSRKATSESFFIANRNAPWYMVAFAMIGTSLSGVTFISIPGMVSGQSWSYMAVVLGYTVGYLVIGTVLMPLYYRMRLVSIYTYLEQRFGFWSYKTGAFFFLISRAVGAAFRLFLVAGVLQFAVFDAAGRAVCRHGHGQHLPDLPLHLPRRPQNHPLDRYFPDHGHARVRGREHLPHGPGAEPGLRRAGENGEGKLHVADLLLRPQGR